MRTHRRSITGRSFAARAAVGLVAVAVTGAGLGSGVAAAAHAKRHTIAVVLTISGTQALALKDYPPFAPAPAPDADGTIAFPGTTVLHWKAKGLGKGSAVQRFDVTPKGGYSISGSLTLDAGDGNVLRTVDQANESDASRNDPAPVTQVGRVEETVGPVTILGGTGRFKGASGTLDGTFGATTVAAEAGVVHRTQLWVAKGKITLR
jgi:hypothetical protein